MMFIEDSLIDNNIQKIILNTHGIANTEEASGKILEAQPNDVSIENIDVEAVKETKANTPAKKYLNELKNFQENIAKVQEILARRVKAAEEQKAEQAARESEKKASSESRGESKTDTGNSNESNVNGLKVASKERANTNLPKALLKFKERLAQKLAKDKEKQNTCQKVEKEEEEKKSEAAEVAKDLETEILSEEYTFIDVDEDEEASVEPAVKKRKEDPADKSFIYNLEDLAEETSTDTKRQGGEGFGIAVNQVESREQSSSQQQFLETENHGRYQLPDRRESFHFLPQEKSSHNISTVSYTIESLFGLEEPTPPKTPPRILNGSLNLPINEFYNTLSPSYSEYKVGLENTSKNSKAQEHFEEKQPEACEEDCESDVSEVETVEAFQGLEGSCAHIPMGLDFLNRIRRIFNIGNEQRQEQRGHKRRHEDLSSSDCSNPNLIKYRKVDNDFPRFITKKFEDDMNPQRNRTVFQPTRNILSASMDPSGNRRSLNQREKTKNRHSLFSLPQKSQKILRAISYADLEFSDDDDNNLVADSAFTAGALLSRSGGGSDAFKKPNTKTHTVQIPIMRASENERSKYLSNMRDQTSSLLSNNFAPSFGGLTLAPEVSFSGRPCYADVVKNGNLGTPYARVTQSSNSDSSAGASAKPKVASSASYWPGMRSVLQQQKQIDEHEKYVKLLQQVAPRLYANENRLNSVAARRNSLLTGSVSSPKSRRSINTVKKPTITINLDDDDDDEEVSITNVSKLPLSSTLKRTKTPENFVEIDDSSSDITEVINLDDDSSSGYTRLRRPGDPDPKKNKKKELPFVEPVNSLEECLKASPHLIPNWLDRFKSRWETTKELRKKQLEETTKATEQITAERKAAEIKLQERFRDFHIVEPDLIVIDDFAVAEEEPDVIEFTPEQENLIKAAIYSPPDKVLISKFNMNITRRDIATLLNQSWLNDEVINFYMNLLVERGEKKHESHGYPKVYAMNTFFIPRLLQGGHSAVRRWTRKIDIFSKDIIPVPVHVGGVHWCMAIIHLKNCSIKYYDSMLTPNPTVLKALEQYLIDESMDKRQKPFDTSKFLIESVRDLPRQMNGSDCGVFSCMFAEYITRNKEITFTQAEMPYFRNKMILEIVQGELLR